VTKTAPVDPESVEIGRRARMIRKRRGLSLDVVAGLSEDTLSEVTSGMTDAAG